MPAKKSSEVAAKKFSVKNHKINSSYIAIFGSTFSIEMDPPSTLLTMRPQTGLFLMGGNSEGIGNASVAAEFNFHADPEAAHVVIETARCPVIIVPWETCYKVSTPKSKSTQPRP